MDSRPADGQGVSVGAQLEPLHPQFRAALKEAHPDLNDADLDRYEELLAARFRIDPDREPERLRELDRERKALLNRVMPRYNEIARTFRQRQS